METRSGLDDLEVPAISLRFIIGSVRTEGGRLNGTTEKCEPSFQTADQKTIWRYM